jgi:hypothetical protein
VIEVKKNSGEDTEKTWSLSYSTYSYAYDVLRSGKTSKELKDAAKALCLYGRAAAVNFSKEEA